MFSASRRRRAAILLAGMSALVFGLPSLDAQGPPGPQLTGGFGGAAAETDEPLILTQHLIPPVTAPLARTWSKLQKPMTIAFPHHPSLEDVLKLIKAATSDKGEPGISIYVEPIGLQEAEKTLTSPVSINLEGIPVATMLDLVLDQLGLTFYVREDGLLVITSDSANDGRVDPSDQILEDLVSLRKEVASLSRDLIPQRRPKGDQKSAPREGQAKKATFRRVVQAPAAAAPEPELPAKPFATVLVNTEITTKAAETWIRLQKPGAMPFENETPLEDVLAFLKKATRIEGKTDLQFYVDPITLQNAEKTNSSPVVLKVDGISIASSLTLMLKQLNLRFFVHDDGFVYITNEESGDDDSDGDDPSARILDEISMLRNEVATLREFSEALGIARRGR